MSRTVAEFRRIYGSEERVEWVKAQPCATCGSSVECVNSHVKNGGMRRKADYVWIIPQCHTCHVRLGQHGKSAFLGMDFEGLAIETEHRYQQHLRCKAAA